MVRGASGRRHHEDPSQGHSRSRSLVGGVPRQPFSIAGVSKKKSLGRSHGFKDKTQGTLFFHVAKIIEAKRPAMLLLENVKSLKSHDGGKTWQVIEGTLRELGYNVFAKVIDAAHWVPQHRSGSSSWGSTARCLATRRNSAFRTRPRERGHASRQ